MNAFRNLALGAALLIGAAATASASTVTYTDTFNPADVFFTNSGAACTGNSATDLVSGANSHGCDSLTFTQTLVGYTPGFDSLTSGTLQLAFHDDASNWFADLFDGSESVNVLTDGNNHSYTLTSAGSTNLSLNVLANLATDGLLNITLSQLSGDFYFNSSTLTGIWNTGTVVNNNPVNDPNNATVPEPTSIIGLGTGLVALARRFRKA